MEISILHQHFLNSTGVSTDSRNIQERCIFFALKGDNFNGNEYASEALEKGAILAIVDEERHTANPNIILVNNTLTTLQQLANYHRNYSKAKIISLTGSNGKTTTKELIRSVMETYYTVIATQGNLNNHIGVPLTLLQIRPETEFAIVEMGANHQKEIELLCSIAEPDYGYITNFGKAHLEGFGGVEGVIKGKSELYDFIKENNKTIFYNADDTIQIEKTANYTNKYSFSLTDNPSDIKVKQITAHEYVAVVYNETKIQSNLIGSYNLSNIAIAICIGDYFNISADNIKTGIENYTPQNNRSQIMHRGTNKIILDAYNANPSSMVAALDNFSKLQASDKLVILGDMFELGATSPEEHQVVLDYAKNLGLTHVITLGDYFYKTSSSYQSFSAYEDLKQYLQNINPKNHLILIKGSRGMKMERLLEVF